MLAVWLGDRPGAGRPDSGVSGRGPRVVGRSHRTNATDIGVSDGWRGGAA